MTLHGSTSTFYPSVAWPQRLNFYHKRNLCASAHRPGSAKFGKTTDHTHSGDQFIRTLNTDHDHWPVGTPNPVGQGWRTCQRYAVLCIGFPLFQIFCIGPRPYKGRCMLYCMVLHLHYLHLLTYVGLQTLRRNKLFGGHI